MLQNSITCTAGLQILIISCILLFLWIRAEAGRNVKIMELKTENFRCCPICTYIYIDAEKNEFSTCPRCSSINKKGENTV